MSLEQLNLDMLKTNLMLESFENYLSEPTEIEDKKNKILAHFKGSEEFLKKIKNQDTKMEVNRRSSFDPNAFETLKKDYDNYQKNLSDNVEELEISLLKIFASQSELMKNIVKDLKSTLNYHHTCQSILQKNIQDVENAEKLIFLKPYFGLGLRDLYASFDCDISIFLTKTTEFLIENEILYFKV